MKNQNTSINSEDQELQNIITTLETDEQYRHNVHLIVNYLESIKTHIKKIYLKDMLQKAQSQEYTCIDTETFALAKTTEGDILSLAIRSGSECGGVYYALYLQSENYTLPSYLALKSFCDTTITRIIGCHTSQQISFFWNYFDPAINFLHLSDKNTLSLTHKKSRHKIVMQHWEQLQNFLLAIKKEITKHFILL